MKHSIESLLETLAELSEPPPRRRLSPAKRRRRIERIALGRRRAARARTRAAWHRRHQIQKNERTASLRAAWTKAQEKRPEREHLANRILAAMEPGRWYGRADIMNLLALPRSHRGKVNAMVDQGWLMRSLVPDFRPADPWLAAAGGAQPQYLYTMTEAGETKRARLLAEPPTVRNM